MNLSQKDLQQIIMYSRGFYAAIEETAAHTKSDNLLDIKLILSKWKESIAKEDKSRLTKRFRWDGFTLEHVSCALSNRHCELSDKLPGWADALNDGLAFAKSFIDLKACRSCRYVSKKNPILFENLLLPFVQSAVNKLQERAPRQIKLLQKKAFYVLVRSLLNRLSNLSVFALKKEFDIMLCLKQITDPISFLNHQARKSKKTNDYYIEFAISMLSGGLIDFFKEYVVLAKLIGTVITFWLKNTQEFLERLQHDLTDIKKTFQPDKKIGAVKNIKMDLSDPHDHGQTVFIVEFASGLKVVYKPRNLGIDVAYFSLLNWFNQQSNVKLDFKLLKVVQKQNHGWVEFAEPLTCENKAAIKLYYKRSGVLICLLTMLAGSDFHFENIIASGEYPVIVDLETLFQPEIKGLDNLQPFDGQSIINRSVIRLGLLPYGSGAFEKYGLDPSGLAGDVLSDVEIKQFKWLNINTDNLSYEKVLIDGFNSKQSNLPTLNHNPQPPKKYLPEILMGFDEMYRFLLKNRALFCGVNSPLTVFKGVEVRRVLRPTQTYMLLLRQSLQPKYLRDGLSRSILLDKLARPLLFSRKKPGIWSAIRLEHSAMDVMDVPKFIFKTDNKILFADNKKILNNLFVSTGYEAVIENFKDLSEDNLEFQSKLINYSLSARYIDKQPVMKNKKISFSTKDCLSDEDFLKQSKLIADDLVSKAIVSKDGVTWIQISIDPATVNYCLQQTEHDLYNGVSGIALFLIAASEVFQKDIYRDVALKSLQTLLNTCDDAEYKFIARTWGIGGISGLGSVIYALTRINGFLNEPKLLNAANSYASLISPYLISEDKSFDIISGSAGAILSLLNLYDVTHDKKFLQKAMACGEHLLKNRIQSGKGYKVWRTLEDTEPMTGFSHGAAGIAYALLKLYGITQNTDLLKAAEEAVAYEASMFCADANNWLDFRGAGKKEQFCNQWCHGAPGVGLGRVGGLNYLDNDAIRQDIEAALITALSECNGFDHLCCGNFGKIDFILEASRRLSRPDLYQKAKQYASCCIASAHKKSCFSFMKNLSKDTPVLSLFRGTAGVGYELLRLVYPDKFPSVLLLG